MTKPAMNPKTVKLALKIAGVVLAVALAVTAEWEAGALTDGAQLVAAIVQALSGALNGEP